MERKIFIEIKQKEMKTNTKDLKIVPLSEDIRQIVKTTGKGQLEMMRFCKDHSNPYVLDDKKPVFYDIGQDQFLGIFDFGANHYFLSPEQVYRFGIFHKLGMYQIIALMVKCEWEIFFLESLGYIGNSTNKQNSKLLNKNRIEKHISDFHPDKGRMYALIRELPYAKASKTIRSHINLIIEDMILEHCFLFDNLLIPDFYPEKEYSENQLLKNAPEALAKEYNKLKYLWKRRTTELEEKLLEGEKKKRINQNLEDAYYRTFGKLELDKIALSYTVEKYIKVLELKEKKPELTYKQTVKKAIETLKEIENKARELKNTYMRSLHCISGSMVGGAVGISQSEIAKYKEEVKELLKKLFFLLHSDTCPVQELSDAQKSGINELWLELMSSKDELFSYTPDMLMWSLPDLDRLLSILRRACEILDIKMEDLDVADRLELMIRKGTPIKKMIVFLKQEIENLQLHLTNLEIIQDEYTNEIKTQLYRDALENVEDHKVKFETEILALKKRISELKDKIKLVFKKVLTKNHTT